MWIQTVALGLNATVLVQVGSPLQMVAFAVWGHCQPPNQESICDDVGNYFTQWMEAFVVPRRH